MVPFWPDAIFTRLTHYDGIIYANGLNCIHLLQQTKINYETVELDNLNKELCTIGKDIDSFRDSA